MSTTGGSLRDSFLKPTLRNAARLQFYQALWGKADWPSIAAVSDLERLPTIDKRKYTESLMLAGEALASTAFITHTSGTTGSRTWRHRSFAEAAVINQIFGLVERPEPPAVVLMIGHARHGMAMPVPAKAYTFPIAISDDAELHHAARMLATDFRFDGAPKRPSGLVGGVQEIAILSQYLLENGRASDLSTIRTLQLLGFVDEGLRSFLRSIFANAAIFENFSLTEIFGGATRWPSSEDFVLDRYVIGEVVDEDGLRVRPGEVGELTLTELFPFVQMQPLIRYRTGDIVQLVADDEEFRFTWWGRRHQCARTPKGGRLPWVFGYRALADWLSLQPLSAREAHRPHLSVSESGFGRMCLNMDTALDGTIVLDLGVRFNPWAEHLTRAFLEDLWWFLRQSVTHPSNLRIRIELWHVPRQIQSFDAAGGLAGLIFEAVELGKAAPSVHKPSSRRARLEPRPSQQP